MARSSPQPLDYARVAPAPRQSVAERLPVIFLIALYTVVVLQTAWLSDDGYITMRTVDNFTAGRGLTWNPGERVQAYTHPLWMLLESGLYRIIPDAYYVQYALALSLSLAAVVTFAFAVAATPMTATLGLCIFVVSKAFVDYSTSGLENPATHLLLFVFAAVFLHKPATRKTTFALALLAALGMTNRMDAALLFAPALAVRLWSARSWRTLAVVALGSAPFVAWEIFSFLYYGSFLPNTAYAKLNSGVPAGAMTAQGLFYLLHTVRSDPVTMLVLLAGLLAPLAALREGGMAGSGPRTLATALSAGAVLYLLYVVRIGGDFMGGRMLTPPLVLCAITLTGPMAIPPRAVLIAIAVALIAGLASPHCPVYNVDPGRLAKGRMDEHGVADERSFYYHATGLLNVGPGHGLPEHEWIDAARATAASGQRVVVVEHIGLFGYYVGPHVYVIDELALADPLLARIPPDVSDGWRVGHLRRRIPAGYVETIESGQNRIADARIAEMYERGRLITQGDLFDKQRWRAILGRP